MLTLMDAFQEAVERARQHLSTLEGAEVTEAELIRRTNLPESRKRSVAYHLNPNVDRKRGHQVPPDIVRALADVLLVSADEMAEAARIAAGFDQPVGGQSVDLPAAVARFLGDDSVDPQEREEVEDRILEVLLRMRRNRRRR